MTDPSLIRIPLESELNALIDMLTRAYVMGRPGFPDDPEVLRAYSTHDPASGPANWVVLWEDDRPVSALRLFYRQVSTPSGPIPIGGIGNVGTDPDQGGRGLGSRVMRAAHDRLRDEGIPVALLVTDIPEFYARLGYRPVEQAELLGERHPADARHEPDPEARPLPREAPASVREMHRDRALRSPGRVLRSEPYWIRWIHDFRIRSAGLDALHRPDAYLIGRHEEGGNAYRALEGGGTEDGLARLLSRAAGGAVRLKTPDDSLFRAVLERLGASVARRARTGIMALPLTPGAPGAEAFTGYLELDTF